MKKYREVLNCRVKINSGDFPWLYDLGKISGATDIGIPNGPAEDGTRGLPKAHDSKNKKNRKPKVLLRKARVVLGNTTCNLAGWVGNPPGLYNLCITNPLAPPPI